MRKDTGYIIFEKFQRFVGQEDLIRRGDRVIAGVSGGADSLVMLDLLCRMREMIPFALCVVHVHHGIRGEEADRDAGIVDTECRNRGLSCRIARYDVPALARKWHQGEEEAGRRVRFGAFAREAYAGSSFKGMW